MLDNGTASSPWRILHLPRGKKRRGPKAVRRCSCTAGAVIRAKSAKSTHPARGTNLSLTFVKMVFTAGSTDTAGKEIHSPQADECTGMCVLDLPDACCLPLRLVMEERLIAPHAICIVVDVEPWHIEGSARQCRFAAIHKRSFENGGKRSISKSNLTPPQQAQ